MTLALVWVFLLGLIHVTASDLSQGSPDYSLAGVARFEGISYAILVDRQTNEHVLLSSDKPDHGLSLKSVTPDSDISGPTATIQKNGESILLSLDSQGALTLSPTPSSTAPVSHPGNVPMPGSVSVNITKLNPPAGASLPLVFQQVDTKALHLTEEQQATLNQLRQDFIKAVNGKSPGDAISTTNSPQGNNQNTTTDSQQLQNWETAQEQSDEQFKLQFGWQAFNQYQMSLSNQIAP